VQNKRQNFRNEISAKKGLLISFDFDHAFDRVNHHFLIDLLSKLNFNTNFIEVLRKIPENSFSRILINEHFSEEVEISSSVRQGDPLIMMLIVIYLNTLLEKLDAICTESTDLCTAYADDVTMLVDSNRKLTEIQRIFTDFERISGARLNYNKTICIRIGNFHLPTYLYISKKIK
jgi:hypothetical protein